MKKFFLTITSSILIIITVLLVITLSSLINLLNSQEIDKSSLNKFLDSNAVDTSLDPKLTITKVVEGLTLPWDLAFIDHDFFYYTQKIGEIRAHNNATNEDLLLVKPENVYVHGEGGLLSIQKDSDFASNHYLYTCMDIKKDDSPAEINVVRWKVSQDLKQVLESKVIISDIFANESGQHSGCRIDVSKDGSIWIGTGDNAVGSQPQDPKSLSGKVLRVDREGNGVSGNLTAPYDPRIFNYGHRNIQGIILFPEEINGVFGLTAEHGTGKDDEINLLKQGNFGWDPVPEYNEGVEMTDLVKFPDAIPAIWSSGNPTIAISGMTILKGTRWKAWKGAVLTAVLKDKHVRLQTYDENWQIIRDEQILQGFGRIRTVVQGLDGDLYFCTDNGGKSDVIMKVTPE